jgi:hypothetical protein
VTRFPFEKYEDDRLAPKFANIPKVMIGGAIAVDVKGMTNAKGNVDSNSYVDHVLPKLAEFYDEVRTQVEYQPLLLQDNATSHTAYHAVAAGMQEVPSFLLTRRTSIRSRASGICRNAVFISASLVLQSTRNSLRQLGRNGMP